MFFLLNKYKNGPKRPYNRPNRAKNVWKRQKMEFSDLAFSGQSKGFITSPFRSASCSKAHKWCYLYLWWFFFIIIINNIVTAMTLALASLAASASAAIALWRWTGSRTSLLKFNFSDLCLFLCQCHCHFLCLVGEQEVELFCWRFMFQTNFHWSEKRCLFELCCQLCNFVT